MIGVLDPAFLFPLEPSPDAEVDRRRAIDQVLDTCRRHHITLPRIDDYWDPLWRQFGRPFEQTITSPDLKQAVRQLWRRSGARRLPAMPPGAIQHAGFDALFGADPLDQPWMERMIQAVARAVLSGEQTVLLVRLLPQRNLVRHRCQHVTLDEITCWMVRVQVPGDQGRSVRCVHHGRNIDLNWTCRFDWRLPAERDGAKYPFCPPRGWWRRRTPAWRSVQAKPAWLDRFGNGWLRPNIPKGRGHHWDLVLRDRPAAKRLGTKHINVVEFDAPNHEGQPGQVHHPPAEVKRLADKRGWQC